MIIRKLGDKKPNILLFQGSPRDKETCLETIFSSLRQFFVLKRQETCLKDKFFVIRHFFAEETKKLVSETTFWSQRHVLSQYFLSPFAC